MKTQIVISFLFLVLTACSVTNRIIKTDDTYKGLKGFRLDQNPKAFSAEKIGTIWGNHVLYPFSASYIYEEDGKNRPKVFAEFQIRTPLSADELDSVLFFNLDGEKIRMVACDYKNKQLQYHSTSVTTTTSEKKEGKAKITVTNPATIQTTSSESGDYQLMILKFSIPENLWVSIAAAETIQFRLYLGKEGVDVNLNIAEKTKFKKFFKQADTMRTAAFPLIPEGLKKW